MWRRAAEYGKRSLGGGQLEALEQYVTWLKEEAIPAGAVGPREEKRLVGRHVGDSLLFAAPLSDPVREIRDLGSGAGLPGIPLAILMPETCIVLVERSGRRAHLLRRAVRVLDLSNVEVWEEDVARLKERTPVLVSRATLTPDKGAAAAEKLLQPGGIAVWGGSWVEEPHFPGWEAVEIPEEVLDRRVWLLIMRPQ